MCSLTTCHNSFVLGSRDNRPASPANAPRERTMAQPSTPFFLHTLRAHGSLPSAGESCTLMDRCSCAHARTRPCEASTGLATISAAKGSALTVGHLTARSQAPQSPRQLGCRRAAGSLYPRGACGTAASGPAASGSGGGQPDDLWQLQRPGRAAHAGSGRQG